MNGKKPILENPLIWLLIPGLFVFLFMVAVFASVLKGDTSSSASDQATIETAAESTEESASEPTDEISKTLPEEEKPVVAQLREILDSLNVKYSDLDIYQDDPDHPQYIISYLSEETFWNEKDFVIDSISNYVKLCGEAYPKDIDKIELIIYVKMTDARGNETNDRAFDMCMTKEHYDQYNWENLKLSTVNYDLLESDCEELYVHPGIAKNVDFNDLYYR